MNTCVYLDRKVNSLLICFECTKITKIVDELSRKTHKFHFQFMGIVNGLGYVILTWTITKKFSGTEYGTSNIHGMKMDWGFFFFLIPFAF